ncbi:hypothetical protein ACOSP7_032171 [Xanthoceras sorbifolium]
MSKIDSKMDGQDAAMKKMDGKIDHVAQQNQAAIQKLEVQIGQIARDTQNRAHGPLPSNTELNPNEHCKAITLRSGKEIENTVGSNHSQQEAEANETSIESPSTPPVRHNEKSDEPLPPVQVVKAYVPPVPFPQRLQKHKEDKNFTKFLKIFKKLHINIPFAEALAQMPSYVKFLKEILSKKRRLEDHETVALTEECSAIIQNKLPQKLKDPGSFTIPCTIRSSEFVKALCDLGASINLIPFSVFRKLGLGEVKPTSVTLQLADRSVKYPYGVIEDVLVKVDKFYFPVDFIVLEMEEDVDIPLILGRPFLATRGALIDVQQGKLTLCVGDEEAVFNVFKATKFATTANTCLRVDAVDSLVEEAFEKSNPEEPLEACLAHGETKEEENDSIAEYAFHLDSAPPIPYGGRRYFEDLGHGKPKILPSIEKPPKLELKQLPEHLRYAYLGESNSLPVIISATLNETEEEKLLGVLGWTISDIKGISPTMCIHKILMEDNFKTSIEHQRRLNPIMKEVVRAEILKLLDAGIIYPISDSS